MAVIAFYEKPGCINNTRQKQLLLAAGHEVRAFSILEHPWTTEELRPFFAEKPVREWFNMAAPRVKSGEVEPGAYTPEQALALMVDDHLLIKRPLMESAGVRMSGFDPVAVDQWLGLNPVAGREQEVSTLLGHDLQHCPRPQDAEPCPLP